MISNLPADALGPDLHEVRLSDGRARAMRLIADLTGDFDAEVEASRAVATDDEHDSDGATIAFERAQIDAILTMTRAYLADVDLALARVRDGTYGVCQTFGRPIGVERLGSATCRHVLRGVHHAEATLARSMNDGTALGWSIRVGCASFRSKTGIARAAHHCRYACGVGSVGPRGLRRRGAR